MRVSTRYMIIAALLLGAANYWVLGRQVDVLDPSGIARTPTPLSEAELPDVTAPDEGGRGTGVAAKRPLFSSSKPSSESHDKKDATRTAKETQEEFALELRGVIIRDDVRLVFLRKPGNKKLLRLAQGEKSGRWSVSKIEPTQVTLRAGDDTLTLTLKTGPNSLESKSNRSRRATAERSKQQRGRR